MMSTEETGKIPKTRVVRKRQPDNTLLPTEDDIRQKMREQTIERRSKLSSVSDRLAGSTFHYRNWYFKEGKEAFPQHVNLRYVGKMYPFADGGPLLVDEPRFDFEVERCEMKKKTLLSLGYRYVIIKPNMSLLEAAEGLSNALVNCE
jgi:hypothetical protein